MTRQLGRVACAQVLLGHVKSTLDLSLLSCTTDCLLRIPPRWKPLTSTREHLVGVYACIDPRRGFVRSGKTLSANANFGSRKLQHQRGAENPTSKSHRGSLFYSSQVVLSDSKAQETIAAYDSLLFWEL